MTLKWFKSKLKIKASRIGPLASRDKDSAYINTEIKYLNGNEPF